MITPIGAVKEPALHSIEEMSVKKMAAEWISEGRKRVLTEYIDNITVLYGLPLVINQIVVEYLKIQFEVIGPLEWSRFGKVAPAPKLPENIYQILQKPCPFWPKQMIGETHALVYLPSQIDDKPLTADFLVHTFIKKHFPLSYRPACLNDTYFNKKFYYQASWILVTKESLPDSGKLTLSEQSEFINNTSIRSKIPYKMISIIPAIINVLFRTISVIDFDKSINISKEFCVNNCLYEDEGLEIICLGSDACALVIKELKKDNVLFAGTLAMWKI